MSLHTLRRALGKALRFSAVSAEPMLSAWGRWRPALGISVSSSAVRAVLVERGRIRWAGQADYATVEDLAEVIARLAGEAERPVSRARIVLERDVLQLRSVTPAPPLKGKAVPGWVVDGQIVALVMTEETVTVTPVAGDSRLPLSSTARLLIVTDPDAAGTQV